MRISVYSFIISAILLTASCSSINKKCKDITFGELSKDVQDTLQCVSQKVIEEDYSPKAMIDFSGKCKFIGSSDKVRGIPTQISTIHDRKRTVCP